MEPKVAIVVVEHSGQQVKYDDWLGTELQFLGFSGGNNEISRRIDDVSSSPVDSSRSARSPESSGSSHAPASVGTPASSVSPHELFVEEEHVNQLKPLVHTVDKTAAAPSPRKADDDDDDFVQPPLPKRVKRCHHATTTCSLATIEHEARNSDAANPENLAVPVQFEPRHEVYKRVMPDSPTALLEMKSELNLGPMLDELLSLFFINTHPYFPVVDEFDFDACSIQPVQDDVLRTCRACLLGAMLLCASVNLKTDQALGQSQWDQTHLQLTLYRATKDLYEKVSDQGDAYVLCQATVLLSYWTPSYAEPKHSCSTWNKHAFRHAEAAGLHNSTPSAAIADRRHLIWCCCLMRDTLLSFRYHRDLNRLTPSSRSGSRLTKHSKSRPLAVAREDFGLEICLPRYADVEARLGVVDCFVGMHRLSELLANVVELRTDMRTKVGDEAHVLGRDDILRVAEVEVKIRQWTRQLRKWKMAPARVLDGIDGGGTASYYLSNVVAESAIVSLYLPFVDARCKIIDTMASQFPKDALRKVKDASITVADTIRDLLMYVPPEEIPPFVYSWLPLPILVLLVSLKFGRRRQQGRPAKDARGKDGIDGSSTVVTTAMIAQDAFCLRHLLFALRVLKKRFYGARRVLDCVNDVSREMKLGAWDTNEKGKKASGEKADGTIMSEKEEENECAVLRTAAEIINQKLRDGQGVSDV